MTTITNILTREIIDSRGNPTIEVDVHVSTHMFGRAAAPSGASTGRKEALELRDKDPVRFKGKGTLRAIENVTKIIKPSLLGQDCSDQKRIDSILLALDGTENKSQLGANAIVATSMAVSKVAALAQNKQLFEHLESGSCILPIPLMNIINGGAHANNALDIQEFMIVPVSAPNIKEAIRYGAEVFSSLKELLASKGLSTSVGDEGGFAPALKSNKEALELIMLAIEKAGYRAGHDILLALDVAASELYNDNLYTIENKQLTSAQLVEYFESLISHFPICSIEDAMAEDDYDGWRLITRKLGDKTQLVGDDVFVTNAKIFSECINKDIGNAILIKPNQVGTISETLSTIKLAKKHGYSCVMSHRSGETEDTTIAHLAVGWGCNQIKIGSICRTDRTAKYNELIRIEERLGSIAQYATLKSYKVHLAT